MSRKLTLLLFMVLCVWLQPASLWAQAVPEQNEAVEVKVPEDILLLGKTKSLTELFKQMTQMSAMMDQADNETSIKASLARTLGVDTLDTINLDKPAGIFVFNPQKTGKPAVVLVISLKDKSAYLEAVKRSYEVTVDKAVYSFVPKEGKPELNLQALLTDNLIYAGNNADVLRGMHQWQKAGEEFDGLKVSALGVKIYVRIFKDIVTDAIDKLEAAQKSGDKSSGVKQSEYQSQKMFLLTAQKIFADAKSLTLGINMSQEGESIEFEYEPDSDSEFAKQIMLNEAMPSSLIQALPNNTCLAAAMRLNPETIKEIISWHLATMPSTKTEAAAKLVNDAIRKYADSLKKVCDEEHAFAILSPAPGKTGLSFVSVYQVKDMAASQQSLRTYFKEVIASAQNSSGGPEIKFVENAGSLDKTPFDRIIVSALASPDQQASSKPQDKIIPALLGAQTIELNIYYQKNSKENKDYNRIIFAMGAAQADEIKQIIGNLENPTLANNSLGNDKNYNIIRGQHPTNSNLFVYLSVNDLLRAVKSVMGEIGGKFSLYTSPTATPPLSASIVCDKGKLRCLIYIPTQTAQQLGKLSQQGAEVEEEDPATAKDKAEKEKEEKELSTPVEKK